MKERDEELTLAFNHFSRSKAAMSLRLMRAYGLLPEDEIAQLSPEFQRMTGPEW